MRFCSPGYSRSPELLKTFCRRLPTGRFSQVVLQSILLSDRFSSSSNPGETAIESGFTVPLVSRTSEYATQEFIFIPTTVKRHRSGVASD